MAYSYLGLYKLHQDLFDKSGSPYIPKPMFDRLVSMKVRDYVNAECEKLEVNQMHTNMIHDLYEPFQKAASSVIIFPDDIPNFWYLIRFYGKFNVVCGGVTTTITSPIYKAQNDDIDVLQNDPFNKATDEEPLYLPSKENGKKVFRVFSTTTPVEINATYIRAPKQIDVTNNPNTFFELPDDSAEQIIRELVLRSDVMIENLQRAQAEAPEIAQLNQI